MSVSVTEVKHIAKLSKLRVNDEQCQYFVEQLNDILHLVEQLKSIECEGVEPLTSVHNFNLPLREDNLEEAKIPIASLFQNAPGSDAALVKELHYYIVPKVLD